MIPRLNPFFVALILWWLPGATLQAGNAIDASSPEALAMTFVQAFRAADIDTLMRLEGGTPAEPRQRRAWRTLVRDYRLAGYRVARLDGADRARWAQGQRNFPPLPIRKFTAQLQAKANGRQRVLERFIGAHDGRFHFVRPAPP